MITRLKTVENTGILTPGPKGMIRSERVDLIAAIWNFRCAYDTLKRIELNILPKDLDDLPYSMKQVEIKKSQKIKKRGFFKKIVQWFDTLVIKGGGSWG